jgi:3-phenylpropionate/trans-cinnamate dioxygenase ferredoxin subunit
MTLYFLCGIDEVPENEIKQFTLNGKEILVINQNMKFFCLETRCTHAGAPLAEGELENGVLKCPWHGSKFNIETGEVVRGPAKKQLPIYHCLVKDQSLFVEQ